MTYAELVSRISPKLKRITHRLNGRFTFFNDEDLLQEALMHLWVSFQEGRLADKTDSYILQGCYFHIKNYLRKVQDKADLLSIEGLKYEKCDSDRLDVHEICLKDSCVEDPRISLENRLLIETIKNNGLTKREKEVLSLCLEGLTVREMAKKLGVSHVRIVKLKTNIKRKSKYLFDPVR